MPRKKRGSVILLMGAQWGDEGKGKFADFLSKDADIGMRVAGGGNAGHSVENERGKFKLRTIPVTILNEHCQYNIQGAGMVLDFNLAVSELKALQTMRIDCRDRIIMDSAAHLVMPWHKIQDKYSEEDRALGGEARIRTTGNGIGPAYADKSMRENFRIGDLLNFKEFKIQFSSKYYRHVNLFERYFYIGNPMPSERKILDELEENLQYIADNIGPLESVIRDSTPILWDALAKDKKILVEGSQGALLDLDRGSYPYVTSSNTGVPSSSMLGFPSSKITEVLAVVKAYATRVGAGPMPTRMIPETEEKIRKIADEYGTVTGRPRFCGWFDPLAANYAYKLHGVTGLAVTCLDILDNFPLIGVCRGYSCLKNGVTCKDAAHMLSQEEVHGAIDYLSGWRPEKVKGCQDWNSLPDLAKKYLLEEISCGVPIKYVSTGPAREETIVV